MSPRRCHLPPAWPAAVLLWLLAAAALPAQTQVPGASLRFHTDTTAVGMPFRATAVFTYPAGSVLLLPDSAKGFQPFLPVRRERLRHDSLDRQLRDSVFYLLRTFELDSVQRLTLRYAWVDNGDTVWGTAGTDSLRLHFRVAQVTANTPLRPDFSLAHIERPFNYALWISVATILVFLLVLAWVFGRKPYLRWRARKRLERQYLQLRTALAGITALRVTDPLAYVNRLNALWKDYLAADVHRQLRSLTPRELERTLRHEPQFAPEAVAALVDLARIEEALNYAHQPVPPARIAERAATLDTVLDEAYHRRKEAVL